MFGRAVGRLTLVVSGGLVLVAVIAGGAYAVGARSGGVITVCVHKRGGALYAASKCTVHDSKLSWNQAGQQGIQGVQGIQGKQGVQGIQGAAGSGPDYYAKQSVPVLFSSPVPLNTLTEVLTLPGVPPGTYSVTANVDVDVEVNDQSGSSYDVECDLEDGNDQLVLVPLLGATDGSGTADVPVSLGGAIKVTATESLFLSCENTDELSATTAVDGEIQAVQVSSVNP